MACLTLNEKLFNRVVPKDQDFGESYTGQCDLEREPTSSAPRNIESFEFDKEGSWKVSHDSWSVMDELIYSGRQVLFISDSGMMADGSTWSWTIASRLGMGSLFSFTVAAETSVGARLRKKHLPNFTGATEQ